MKEGGYGNVSKMKRENSKTLLTSRPSYLSYGPGSIALPRAPPRRPYITFCVIGTPNISDMKSVHLFAMRAEGGVLFEQDKRSFPHTSTREVLFWREFCASSSEVLPVAQEGGG